MSHRFVRCPHCKMPHDAAVRVCPTTGRRMGSEAAGRSRMSELPPPERRPEPLAFDPKNRIAERANAKASEQVATVPPTRNLQADLIGRVVSDRYRVRGVLGEGGMGTVYDAEHLGLGRNVAIKVLNPTQAKKRVAVKRFQQEARAAGAIGHPNICEVYDLGQLDDGSPYLVMEKLVGSTLAERITREGGLPFDEIIDVMIQVMNGLIAAHDKGIVHRDIKPENIFLARRVGCPPIVKILDFGVSKMMPQFQGGDEQLDLTRTGMVMGTPYYMSPEQARGERNLDGRVDVYACGVMMYESIAGKRPFLAPNYNALLLSIINSSPKPLRDVRPATPPALEAIVVRAMAKARDDRYPTANAALRDLQALAAITAGPGVVSRVPAPPTADERLRAPVLGGAMRSAAVDPRAVDPRMADPRMGDPRAMDPRASQTRGSRHAIEAKEGPGATLRSRMNEPDSSVGHRSEATRLDIKVKERPKPDSDSIEIPIHVTGSDLSPVRAPGPPPPAAAARNEIVDDVPTEIFRPGKHPSPPGFVAPSSASATQLSPQPPSRNAQGRHPDTAPTAFKPAQPPPVDISGLTGDDWDAATVVKRPAALSRPASKREPKPFNPDETVALQGEIDVDVDFDETLAPPSRRR